jgi:hypothetical protein
MDYLTNYYKNLSEQLEAKYRRLLNEVESPFQIDSPLSSGGPSDDPNTRHLSSAEQISSEEEPVLAYYEPYYMDLLNQWRAQGLNDPIWERIWMWMAMNWHRDRIENPGGIVPPYYTHRDMVYIRDVLAQMWTANPNDNRVLPPDWPRVP